MINLRKETAHKLQLMGISEDLTFALFDQGLIDERTAKKFLVREEYHEANPCKGHKSDVKSELADKFCCSFETVNLYVKD